MMVELLWNKFCAMSLSFYFIFLHILLFHNFFSPGCIIKIVKIRIKMKIQRNREMSRSALLKIAQLFYGV